MMRIEDFCQELLSRAKKAGCQDAEAYAARACEFSARARGGKLEEFSSGTTQGVSLRAMVNGKVGYGYTESITEDALEDTVRGAMNGAVVVASPDPQFFAEGGAHYAAVDSFSSSLEEITAQAKIDAALRMEQAAMAADPRFMQCSYCNVETSSGRVWIANTRGLSLSRRGNMVAAYVNPVLRDGERMVDDMAFFVGRDFAALDVEALAREATGKAASMIGAASVPSGRKPIVLDRHAMAQMLGAFLPIFSAEQAQRGLSPLAGREGDAIAAPFLTLRDDAHRFDALSPTPFDAEGTPTARIDIVAGGVLTTLMHNLKTAHKAGVASTGHAARGSYKGTVGVSHHGLAIEPGKGSTDDLMAQAEGGILVTSLEGTHSGANSVSCDFSLLARGFTIENGRRGRPVERITIAGNFLTLLAQAEAVGDDFSFDVMAGGVGAPSVFVGALSVAGV